ncbi:MAG TPA: NADH:flavin oxidoreductase/NADH oxidase [Bacteroidia bacterium]|nr:NADH:flavin oxidoreductase/NADH oxidase [Bacteroidia bacterium]
MPHLFSPLKIRSLELKNRIIVSPMCQYSSKDGFANEWHLVHLGSRAVGGAAMVITEATAVSPEGRISPSDLGIWLDEHISYLKKITSFIEEQGCVPGIQLAHAGRKASHQAPWNGGKPISEKENGWQTVGPSALAFADMEPIPVELSAAEIDKIKQDFKVAAARALKAGFKVIELHAAHGYLLHEFLSPYSNKRTDKYGGSFDNRILFLLEIITAVREVWPEELPLFVRISATEWVEGNWSESDSIKLAEILKDKTVDLIDCSTGGNIPHVKIPIVPMYQTPFAENIKKQTGILTGAVGMITTSKEANHIIESNKADVVLLARELLRDPYFPLKAAHELQQEVVWPKQYERAKRKN